MARHSKRRPSTSRIIRQPSPDDLKLTKKDVVRQELRTAIRLYILGGDPVAIHVLASAASAIMRPIGESMNTDTWRVLFLDIIHDEYRDDAATLIDESFNFMKHGGKDADQTISFNPEVNSALLLLLCRDFLNIFQESFVEIGVLLVMMTSTHAELFNKEMNDTFRNMADMARNLAGADVVDRATAARALAEYDRVVRFAAKEGIDLGVPGIS